MQSSVVLTPLTFILCIKVDILYDLQMKESQAVLEWHEGE